MSDTIKDNMEVNVQRFHILLVFVIILVLIIFTSKKESGDFIIIKKYINVLQLHVLNNQSH